MFKSGAKHWVGSVSSRNGWAAALARNGLDRTQGHLKTIVVERNAAAYHNSTKDRL